ncbi:MAG TPA: holo-ACP synthase [Ktedonobacterales bacterium]|nr:holo-ACP synthase [Ktedonobacterales bacterium]
MADESAWTFPAAGLESAVVIGVDLFERDRLRQSYARRGERLLRRLFTPLEVEQARGDILRLASRFAAKEACAKALGAGIGKVISWQDIEIGRLPTGKPSLTLRGGALTRARELGLTAFDISISDTGTLVIAVVAGVRG